MAVVIVRAEDGVAVAADAVSGGSDVWKPGIFVSGVVAWGCAGPLAVGERVRRAFEEKDRSEPGWVAGSPHAESLRDAVTAIVVPALTASRREGVEARALEQTTILLGAYLASGPCAIITYGNGSGEVVQGEYLATGPGELAATALMRQLARMHETVRQAQVVAWAAARQAIAWTPELQEPISLAVVKRGETGTSARLLDEYELYEIGAAAELWLEKVPRSAGEQDGSRAEAAHEEPPSPPE